MIMKKLFYLLMVAMILVACGKESEQTTQLRLTDGASTELQFEGIASSKSVSFCTNVNWMVRMEQTIDWFSVTPLYGEAGDVTLTVSVEEYTGDVMLEGSFDIVAGDKSLTIEVVQHSAFDPESDYVYIPDTNFEKFLVANYDDDYDGRISRDEAEKITSIVCTDQLIESIEGIKNFTSLVKLDCSYNAIKGVVDLSGMTSLEELYIDHNRYTSLNLMDCANLRIVEANDNIEYAEDYRSIFHMKEINLRGCTSLVYLELTDNAIEEIDLSDCTKLEVLRMTWNNLKTIDVTMCPKLTHLYVRKNLELAGTLDLSACTALVELWCGESQLQGLNLANEHPALETIICYDSRIESLDLSTCPGLRKLEAHSMALTELDVTGCSQLEHLWLKFNAITELDLTSCPMLNEVQVGYNQISTLDLSNSPYITILEAVYNGLTELNLEGCSNLATLNVSMNELAEIDLADCEKLFQVNVADNNLTTLDVSNKSELMVLNFENNQVAELDITNTPNLTLLYAGNNKLRSLDLRITPLLQEVLLPNNELETLLVDGLQYMYQCEFQKNRLERLNLDGCVSISELYVQDNPLAYFSVYPCTALNQLDMRRTAMKSIDLSNNVKASFLFAEENPQLETVYIAVGAEYSALSVDDHVEVWYKEPGSYDDVNSGNWGDEELNPWGE